MAEAIAENLIHHLAYLRLAHLVSSGHVSGLDIAGDNGELSGTDLTAGHGEGSGSDVSVANGTGSGNAVFVGSGSGLTLSELFLSSKSVLPLEVARTSPFPRLMFASFCAGEGTGFLVGDSA